MSWTTFISPQRYFAGVNRPFFVSQSMVNGRAQHEGFDQIEWHKRSDTPVPQALPANADNDWDEWISAVYTGAPRNVTFPAQPNWFMAEVPVVLTVPGRAPIDTYIGPAPPVVTPPAQPALPFLTKRNITIATVGVGVTALFLVRRHRHAPKRKR
jgi:hypothetical protein